MASVYTQPSGVREAGQPREVACQERGVRPGTPRLVDARVCICTGLGKGRRRFMEDELEDGRQKQAEEKGERQ